MAETVEMFGLREADEALTRLGHEIAGNVVRRALVKAARTAKRAIEARIRSTFKVRTGRALRGIEVDTWVRPGPGGHGVVMVFRVGPRSGGNTKTDPFYLKFWERGFVHVGRLRRTLKLSGRAARPGEAPDLMAELKKAIEAGTAHLSGPEKRRAQRTERRIARAGLKGQFGKRLRREFIRPAFEATKDRIEQEFFRDVQQGTIEAMNQVATRRSFT